MTLHLAHADDHALLTSDRAVVKRRDRVPFNDALTLLREITALRDQARAEADTARDTARREGLIEARLAAHESVANGLAEITTAINDHAETRRADIAEAAFAAARAIIGDLDETDVMQRIVDRTLARLDGDKPVAIEVAPALVAALTKHTAHLAHVTVTENAGFAPTDCRIHSAQGQIVASLSIQFDALAARWGL
jgi:flagellar biosynthesis/type III secretory pathway protein FliH